MENLFEISPDKLPMTLKSFQKIAKSRGWQSASLIRGKESYIFATRPDGKKLRFLSGAAPGTSYFSGILADDKLASFYIFKDLGIPQPDTVVLTSENQSDEIARLLKQHSSIVIKPSDGGHGNDVFVSITDAEKAAAIVGDVRSRNPGSAILAQQQLANDTPELRVICIDYHFVVALARIPARVTGDGEHTVSELIDLENSTIRTAPYQSNLAFIDKEMSKDYIEKHYKKDYIPAADEKVQVVGMCNIGRGGTVEDVSANFDSAKRAIAEKIARAFQLPIIGIDFLGEYVLEVNSTPSLYYPTGDESSSLCVTKWLEYLEQLDLPLPS